MALRYGPLTGVVGVVQADAAQRAGLERAIGQTLEETMDRYAEMQHFLADRADEARRLATLV
jgi:hypothetical protein